jgi:putative phosphoribosyl transferase
MRSGPCCTLCGIDCHPTRSIAALPTGLFGASTGAAAALLAAARLPERISAVVSRGGRPDLAGDALPMVHAPTLLIVGGDDYGVIELNEEALHQLRPPKALEIVAGATHLFPEPGAMEAVIEHASRWFGRYLAKTHKAGRWP